MKVFGFKIGTKEKKSHYKDQESVAAAFARRSKLLKRRGLPQLKKELPWRLNSRRRSATRIRVPVQTRPRRRSISHALPGMVEFIPVLISGNLFVS